jgi:hypothetical protein
VNEKHRTTTASIEPSSTPGRSLPDERMYRIRASSSKRSRHSSSGRSLTSTSTSPEARSTRNSDQRLAPGPTSNTTAPAGIQRASTSSISACFAREHPRSAPWHRRLPRRFGLPVCFVFGRAHAGQTSHSAHRPRPSTHLASLFGHGVRQVPNEAVSRAVRCVGVVTL